jgi:hypothetical protein
MKSMTSLRAVGTALAIAGVLAFSGQAMADTVTAKFTGMTKTDGIGYSVDLPPDTGGTTKGGSTDTGLFTFDVGVNTDTGTLPSGPIRFFDTDQFVSFCIDLDDQISKNNTVTWNVVSLDGAPDAIAGPMGATKANDIAKVLGYTITSGVLNDARFLSNAKAQAVQAIIWEIVHEKSSNPYDLALGTATFTGLTNAALTEVSDILTKFGTATAMKGLVGLTKDGKQDFVAQVVPIPAAAWLFGSAMVGAVALGRRKKKGEAKA